MTETEHPLPLWRRVLAWFARHAYWIVVACLVIKAGLYVVLDLPPVDAEVGDRFYYVVLRLDLRLYIFLFVEIILAIALTIFLYRWIRVFTFVIVPIIFFFSMTITWSPVGPSLSVFELPSLHTDDATYHFRCSFTGIITTLPGVILAEHCTLLACDSPFGGYCTVVDTVEDIDIIDIAELRQVGQSIQVFNPTFVTVLLELEYVIP